MNVAKYLIPLILLAFLGCSLTPNRDEPLSRTEHGHAHEHDHEHEEGWVSLSAAQREEIGLELASPDFSQDLGGVSRTGIIESDPERRVVVASQVAGILTELPGTVGSIVRSGDLVATLESPEMTRLKEEYHHAEVGAELAAKELKNVEQLVRLNRDSRKELEEAKLVLVQARAEQKSLSARLESAARAHDRLQELLGEGIASVQQVEEALAHRRELEAQLVSKEVAVELAEQHLQREQKMADQRLREKTDLFPAEAALERAEEEVKHLEERIRQLGGDPTESRGLLSLTSPVNGQILERLVRRGEFIEAGQAITVLVDPTEVWVWVNLEPEDLHSLQLGAQVRVALSSRPSQGVEGRLRYIEPVLDSESQTVRGRVALDEPSPEFLVGHFVTVLLPLGEESLPVIPQDALQEIDGRLVVYRLEKERFRRTPVEVVSRTAGFASVRGLSPDDQIVVRGASDVKAVDLAATIGEHTH